MIVPPVPTLPINPAVAVPKELPATKPTAATTAPVFDMLDARTWTGKSRTVAAFPVGCDNPRAIEAHIAGLSTPALREHLRSAPQNETESLQQRYTLAELNRRNGR
jgi:hypothetical protein